METTPETVILARRLRRQMSPPELRLWAALRRGAFDGLKFRRQHPLGRCVLDFYCPALRLAVEVDGYDHCIDGRPERDIARDRWLMVQGVRTLRIPAQDVMASVDGTLMTIRGFIAENRLRPLHRRSAVPLPQGGEESVLHWTDGSPPPALWATSPATGGRI